MSSRQRQNQGQNQQQPMNNAMASLIPSLNVAPAVQNQPNALQLQAQLQESQRQLLMTQQMMQMTMAQQQQQQMLQLQMQNITSSSSSLMAAPQAPYPAPTVVNVNVPSQQQQRQKPKNPNSVPPIKQQQQQQQQQQQGQKGGGGQQQSAFGNKQQQQQQQKNVPMANKQSTNKLLPNQNAALVVIESAEKKPKKKPPQQNQLDQTMAKQFGAIQIDGIANARPAGGGGAIQCHGPVNIVISQQQQQQQQQPKTGSRPPFPPQNYVCKYCAKKGHWCWLCPQFLGKTQQFFDDTSSTPANAKEQIEAEMAVPNELIGLIIGKAGVNIKHIQTESGAKLLVENGLLESQDGKVRIVGTSKQVKKAKQLLKETLARSDQGRQAGTDSCQIM